MTMTDEPADVAIKVKADTSEVERELVKVSDLAKSFGSSMTGALKGAVVDGRELSDVLRSLALQLSTTVVNRATAPLTTFLEDAVSSVIPFAKGGVVSMPTRFPLSGGTGLMGESGPEAIMPLKRGGDGRLGVAASGGQPVQVTVNISTPDARSFVRSEGQVAAVLTRAVGRGTRNL